MECLTESYEGRRKESVEVVAVLQLIVNKQSSPAGGQSVDQRYGTLRPDVLILSLESDGEV